jgi:hypothetical protein
MPVPIVERSPTVSPVNSGALEVRFFQQGSSPMKTNVNWKPQGHSAKKWQGVTLRKDPAALREARPSKKKEQFRTAVWRQPGA